MHGPLGWGRAELIILQVVTQTEACLPDKEVSESHEHEHGYWVAGDSESHLQQKAELVTALQGLGQRRIHTAQQRREETRFQTVKKERDREVQAVVLQRAQSEG